MKVQVEITTRCNFACFYCAGRLLRQGDMPFETLSDLLGRHVARHGVPTEISLQGEGEPTLHRDFFRMAKLVRELGAQPYTITNGSYQQPEHFIGRFDRVGVSVDTLDEAAAQAIGRRNLPRTLNFVQTLGAHLQVVIHSVRNGQHTPAVAAWCKQQGYVHIVQPLQTKPDYSRRYLKQPPAGPSGRFSCHFLAQPQMRYFSLDGTEMPCCFIKDLSAYPGLGDMLQKQQTGNWPKCCAGCRVAARPVAKPVR
jgi:MoaA/NifB/PqqE/SkfB family radical SAM enzyme